MQSARERTLDEDQKKELGLIAFNNNLKRIEIGYTGKVILHFQDGEIKWEETNYKRKLK